MSSAVWGVVIFVALVAVASLVVGVLAYVEATKKDEVVTVSDIDVSTPAGDICELVETKQSGIATGNNVLMASTGTSFLATFNPTLPSSPTVGVDVAPLSPFAIVNSISATATELDVDVGLAQNEHLFPGAFETNNNGINQNKLLFVPSSSVWLQFIVTNTATKGTLFFSRSVDQGQTWSVLEELFTTGDVTPLFLYATPYLQKNAGGTVVAKIMVIPEAVSVKKIFEATDENATSFTQFDSGGGIGGNVSLLPIDNDEMLIAFPFSTGIRLEFISPANVVLTNTTLVLSGAFNRHSFFLHRIPGSDTGWLYTLPDTAGDVNLTLYPLDDVNNPTGPVVAGPTIPISITTGVDNRNGTSALGFSLNNNSDVVLISSPSTTSLRIYTLVPTGSSVLSTFDVAIDDVSTRTVMFPRILQTLNGEFVISYGTGGATGPVELRCGTGTEEKGFTFSTATTFATASPNDSYCDVNIDTNTKQVGLIGNIYSGNDVIRSGFYNIASSETALLFDAVSTVNM